ncbi:hypothetical protein FI667_g8173, partial [Globisporangium splendens]
MVELSHAALRIDCTEDGTEDGASARAILALLWRRTPPSLPTDTQSGGARVGHRDLEAHVHAGAVVLPLALYVGDGGRRESKDGEQWDLEPSSGCDVFHEFNGDQGDGEEHEGAGESDSV